MADAVAICSNLPSSLASEDKMAVSPPTSQPSLVMVPSTTIKPLVWPDNHQPRRVDEAAITEDSFLYSEDTDGEVSENSLAYAVLEDRADERVDDNDDEDDKDDEDDDDDDDVEEEEEVEEQENIGNPRVTPRSISRRSTEVRKLNKPYIQYIGFNKKWRQVFELIALLPFYLLLIFRLS